MIDADILFTHGMRFEKGLATIIETQGNDINEVVASMCVPIHAFGAPMQTGMTDIPTDSMASDTGDMGGCTA